MWLMVWHIWWRPVKRVWIRLDYSSLCKCVCHCWTARLSVCVQGLDQQITDAPLERVRWFKWTTVSCDQEHWSRSQTETAGTLKYNLYTNIIALITVEKSKRHWLYEWSLHSSFPLTWPTDSFTSSVHYTELHLSAIIIYGLPLRTLLEAALFCFFNIHAYNIWNRHDDSADKTTAVI